MRLALVICSIEYGKVSIKGKKKKQKKPSMKHSCWSCIYLKFKRFVLGITLLKQRA